MLNQDNINLYSMLKDKENLKLLFLKQANNHKLIMDNNLYKTKQYIIINNNNSK